MEVQDMVCLRRALTISIERLWVLMERKLRTRPSWQHKCTYGWRTKILTSTLQNLVYNLTVIIRVTRDNLLLVNTYGFGKCVTVTASHTDYWCSEFWPIPNIDLRSADPNLPVHIFQRFKSDRLLIQCWYRPWYWYSVHPQWDFILSPWHRS